MRAKQKSLDPLMVETYNFLGDPALELSVPAHRLALTATALEAGIKVSGRLDFDKAGPTTGRIIVDWLDSAGQVVHSQEEAALSEHFSVEYPLAEGRALPSSASVYFWDKQARIDGIGIVKFDTLESENSQASVRSTSTSTP